MSAEPKNREPLSVTHPSLVKEWNFTKNRAFGPESVTYGSKKKVWWVCAKGHEWTAGVNERSSGNGCPYCSNRKVLFGYNDLETCHPELAKEWDSEKNHPVMASEVVSGSRRKVWWRCYKGHSWKAPVSRRAKLGRGCPYCTNRKILKGYNDLKTLDLEIASEWHPTKNGELLPTDVGLGSHKRVWWKCLKEHEWITSVKNRQNHGCPYCTGKYVWSGEKDIVTTHPNLMEEWHQTKNVGTLPDKLSKGSRKRVWWVCSKGHEWVATPNDRTSGSGCPTCWSKSFVSKGEKSLLDYVRALCPDAKGTYKNLSHISEVDIYVPSKNIAIEYNGLYWHSEHNKGRTAHYDKWKACKDQGIQLIQVWEDEWRDKPEIVKIMLAHKLGHTSKTRVYARKTLVTELSVDMCQSFFELNHIQGYGGGSIRVGLEFEGNLAAAAVFRKRDKTTLELVRYATSENVIGGQSKILKNLKRLYPEFTSVITFADHCVSNGNLYETLGFKKDAELPPDYRYVVGANRVHKFNYRLKRFKEDPDLEYQEGLTERELAQLNGLQRVYDAGKTRYVLDLDLL